MSPFDPGRVVVTGASGFVGRALAGVLGRPGGLSVAGEDWRERIGAASLEGATVFHLAARVHRPGDADEAAYRRDNAEKTRVLAEAAAARGARRLVFLSTIKVNGEESAGRPFRADDPARPQDAYARSKWEAEEALAGVARTSRLEVVVVRAPLVFGPGARGNLRSLLRLADTPWPLPFAAIANRRTLIAVDDLARCLARCAAVPGAAGRTLLAGDPESVSTPRLVTAMRRALGRPPRLFAVASSRLEGLGAVLGLAAAMRRLTRSLEADVTETLKILDWSPTTSLEEGIAAMVRNARGELAP